MRLLVIKLSALGDVIHGMQALGRVRPLAPPGLVVDWAVDSRYAPLLDGHPWLGAVHSLDIRGWWRRGEWGRAVRAVRRLRLARYDAVVDLQGLAKSRLIASLARAGLRAGYRRRDDLDRWRAARESGGPFLTDGAGGAPGPLHVVDEYARLLAGAVGRPAPDGEAAEFRTPLFPVPAEEQAALDAWLVGAGVEAGEPLALVLPGGGWPTKLLPVPSLVAVASRLAGRGFRPLVLWGSDSERQLAEDVAGGLAAAPGPKPVIVPRLPLPRLAALGARVSLAVGGDTGPLHLAAAQGAATVSVYGPTVAARSGPRGRRHRVLQAVVPCGPCFGRTCPTGRFVCMPGIAPAAIAAAAVAALGPAAVPGGARP